MHEVELVLRRNGVEQRMWSPDVDAVPAHMRHLLVRRQRRETTHRAWDQAQTLGVTFLGAVEAELCAHTDAEDGRAERERLPERLVEPALDQDGHRRTRVTHAREDDALRASHHVRVGADP
jgi:hypothetical protein